jgi:NTP pyrophosphatase (non-canonical NTP hydrolase)
MNDRIEDFLAWAKRVFGPNSQTPKERALRFVEEAIELAQAAGIEEEMMDALVNRTYRRPKGDAYKEYCQASLLLEAYGQVSFLVSPEQAAGQEWQRVCTISDSEWERRHAAKFAQGILQPGDAPCLRQS